MLHAVDRGAVDQPREQWRPTPIRPCPRRTTWLRYGSTFIVPKNDRVCTGRSLPVVAFRDSTNVRYVAEPDGRDAQPEPDRPVDEEVADEGREAEGQDRGDRRCRSRSTPELAEPQSADVGRTTPTGTGRPAKNNSGRTRSQMIHRRGSAGRSGSVSRPTAAAGGSTPATSVIGYSLMNVNTTGANRALNSPPSMPPSDMSGRTGQVPRRRPGPGQLPVARQGDQEERQRTAGRAMSC